MWPPLRRVRECACACESVCERVWERVCARKRVCGQSHDTFVCYPNDCVCVSVRGCAHPVSWCSESRGEQPTRELTRRWWDGVAHPAAWNLTPKALRRHIASEGSGPRSGRKCTSNHGGVAGLGDDGEHVGVILSGHRPLHPLRGGSLLPQECIVGSTT
eukprot:Sspe_Gene.39361::Locus_18988_Transcript_1_1_Confidence_1.000_Length_623::g.39361::m.39361